MEVLCVKICTPYVKSHEDFLMKFQLNQEIFMQILMHSNYSLGEFTVMKRIKQQTWCVQKFTYPVS